MATTKHRLRRLNNDGEYDLMYLETGSDLVQRPSSAGSVESTLTTLEAQMGTVQTTLASVVGS